jgi:hypothetical protein
MKHPPPAPYSLLPIVGQLLRFCNVLRGIGHYPSMRSHSLDVSTGHQVLRVLAAHDLIPRPRQPLFCQEWDAHQDQVIMRRSALLWFELPQPSRSWATSAQSFQPGVKLTFPDGPLSRVVLRVGQRDKQHATPHVLARHGAYRLLQSGTRPSREVADYSTGRAIGRHRWPSILPPQLRTRPAYRRNQRTARVCGEVWTVDKPTPGNPRSMLIRAPGTPLRPMVENARLVASCCWPARHSGRVRTRDPPRANVSGSLFALRPSSLLHGGCPPLSVQ